MITDEEIDGVARQFAGMSGIEDYRAFARAIYQLGRQHQRESDAELPRVGNTLSDLAEAILANTGD